MRKLASGKLAKTIVFFEKRFEIPDYDDPCGVPSRVRWRLLHTPWFGVYLHKWNKPDPRRTLHTHPWPFVSIILRGAYLEITEAGDEQIRWFNYCPRSKAHSVITVLPNTWSLMFVGKMSDDWGYIEQGKFIPFDKHPHSREFLDAIERRKNC